MSTDSLESHLHALKATLDLMQRAASGQVAQRAWTQDMASTAHALQFPTLGTHLHQQKVPQEQQINWLRKAIHEIEHPT